MCDIRRPRLTKIKTQKFRALLIIERLIDGKIAQVKENVAHGGVFPIENPDVVPIIDEVVSQQVIVTRRGLMQRPNGLFDLCHQRVNLGQRLRKGHAALEGLLVVIPHGIKGREGAWKSWSYVVTLYRIDYAPERCRLRGSFWG